jgi:hypothetical protein
MTNQLPPALNTLKAQDHWVAWKYEQKKGSDKLTKVPYQARHPNQKAASTKSETWASHAEAVTAFEQSRFDGIGFCLLNSGLAAFDVDDCRDPQTGKIDDWSEALIAKASSYAEVTPSGTGIRIIGRAAGAEVHRRLKASNGVTCEVYRKAKRYITVTGNQIGDHSELADIDAVIDGVISELDRNREARSTHGHNAAASFSGDRIEPDDPRLRGLSEKWIKLGVDGTGIADKYNGDRSRAAMAFTCECVRQRIDDDVIASCLTNWKIGEHIRDQSNAERALRRTIAKAHEFVADSMLFKMNEKHCVLSIAGKTRVATWGDDAVFPGHTTITMISSFGDFANLHNKYRHSYEQNGETKVVPLGTWWLGNSGRRQYDSGMKFDPTCNQDVINGDTLNLWMGFKVAARKPEGKSGAAGCRLFLDHGLKVICNSNEQHYDYLIKREAFIAQRRTRTEIAVGIQTEIEGTGKGVWERGLNYLYGVHAMEIHNPDHVVGKHNPHLEKLLRLTADEALFALNPQR